MSTPPSVLGGFADSELAGYTRDGDTLTVRIKGWNEKLITAKFGGVIGLRDLGCGSFSALVQDTQPSMGFLREVLALHFTVVPEAHGYAVYSFLDHDDEPSLEVVATRCEVTHKRRARPEDTAA